MRISYLSAAALTMGFMSASPAAFAGCGQPTCQSSTSYAHSSSYHSGYSSTTRTAPCPAGSSRSTDGLCMAHGSSVSSHSYSGPSVSYASSATTSSRIVPFRTSVSSISNYHIPGMGAHERLSPTSCPVSVYNPEGGKVLGCYSVVKPKPVVVSVPTYRTVRIVRPIIYVRYPVPVAVPVYTGGYNYSWNYQSSWQGGCNVAYYSRYGNNWPGRPCGW